MQAPSPSRFCQGKDAAAGCALCRQGWQALAMPMKGPSQAPLVPSIVDRRTCSACVQGRTRCCVKKRRKCPQKREPLSGHSPRGYVLQSPALSLSVILLLYIVDFSPCISPEFVVLGFSSNVMQSTVAPRHGCLAGSRCLFSCLNKARGTATKSLGHFQRRSLFRPCSCNCNDTGVQSCHGRSALAPP